MKPIPAISSDLKRALRLKPVTSFDRLPPHDEACEEAIIGCMLLDRASYAEVKEALGVKEAFYSLPCQVAFENFDEKTDFVVLQSRLKDKGLLEQVGGIMWLSRCQESVVSTANLPWWLGIVRDKFVIRKLLQTCTETVAKIYEHNGEVDALLDEVEKDVLAIAHNRETKDAGLIGDCIERVQEKIEYFHQNKGKITGITTGFGKLDILTAGLKGGEAIIIAARPGCGKTAVSMNIAERAAIELGLPVGVFSMEMDKDALTFRMLCGRASVDSKKAQLGDLTAEQFKSIAEAAKCVRKAPLYIDDTPALTINQLRARARRMWQKHQIKLLVIDYLQLMSCPKKKGDYNRQQEIGEISSGVKSLARELNIPIILLSQLNREIDKDKGRKPRLSDLRESGNIEQDADLVLMLYSPAKSKQEEDEGEHDLDHMPINLLIAKQRNGSSDRIIPLTFHKVFTRFEDRKRAIAKVEENDQPDWQ